MMSTNSQDLDVRKSDASKENLHKRFLEAVEIAANTSLSFPPDIRLLFYSFYKIAVENDDRANSETTSAAGNYDYPDSVMVTAFKMNALMQIRSIHTQSECKEKYIELVDKYIINAT